MAPDRTAILWILLVFVLVVGVGSYFWMTVPVDEHPALMRYVRPVTNSVSPYDLQRWAIGVLRERSAEPSSTNEQTPLVDHVPGLVRAIPNLGFAGPQIAFYRAGHESAGQDHVGIAYLGGFGSWGIRVGAETFRLTEDRHCYEWIPGVYITIHP